MPFTYEHPRPAVTVDAVVLLPDGRRFAVLLIRRGRAPFAGRWALPGGFVDIDEEVEAAARRELLEETGVRAGPLRQLGAYGKVGRDPRGRTVSVVYLTVCADGRPGARAGDDAAASGWHPLDRPPPLAFDHREVLADARRAVRELAEAPARLLALLPRRFTLEQARTVFQAALGRRLAREAFRRRLQRVDGVERCGLDRAGAQLFRLRPAAR